MMMLAVLLRIVWWILLIGQFDIPQALSGKQMAAIIKYFVYVATSACCACVWQKTCGVFML